MVRRWLAALFAVVLLLPTGCGTPSESEQAVIDVLREVDGVRKVSMTPALLRSPDHVFVVDLAEHPSADVLAAVIHAYGGVVTTLPSNDVEIYVHWPAGGRVREIKGWGFVMPREEMVRAAADWPEDLDMRAGFYPAQGFVVSVRGSDDDYPALLHRVAGLALPADEAGTYSDRYKVSWVDAPPLATFDAARDAAPTASELRVSQIVDTLDVQWTDAAPEVIRPEMEALVDVWAASPTPLTLTLKAGPDRQAVLDNTACPNSMQPLNQELWAYARRPGHRIVLAPDCPR